MVSRRACWVSVAVAGLWLSALSGCAPNMSTQPRYDPLAPSDFFTDGRSQRPAVSGTVAHGQVEANARARISRYNSATSDDVPYPITRAMLDRGRERFDIYCSPCHGVLGDGQGMVVRRGFRQPPSLHIQRLREAPDSHFFNVITNGFGAMWSYASRVAPEDRWAIAAYIRALQYSQAADVSDVDPAQRRLLEATK